MASIQDEFNTTFIDLASQLAILCPRSFIANNVSLLKSLIHSHPTKILEIFTLKALKYKRQVDSGDDSFFLNCNFASEVNGDSAIIGKIFELKEIWKTLNDANRDIVRQYVTYLFELSAEYLETIVV